MLHGPSSGTVTLLGELSSEVDDDEDLGGDSRILYTRGGSLNKVDKEKDSRGRDSKGTGGKGNGKGLCLSNIEG